MKILIAYASAHGSTGEVAEFIGRLLRAYQVEVTVANVTDVKRVSEYDAYILGSAIHGGLWLHEMCAFTDRFHYELSLKPSYFFITCIRALEPNGYSHALDMYVDHKTLKAFDVRDVAVFTGKLYTNAIDRKEIWYLASSYDGRMTPGLIKDDFRDWERIAKWAISIAKDQKLMPSFEMATS